jgi:hypothetical protein
MKTSKLGRAGVLFLVNFLVIQTLCSQQIKTYTTSKDLPDFVFNHDFTVRVRMPGKAWQDLYEYNVKVDEVRGTKHHVENASMCSFDFSGEVDVEVKSNKGEIQHARVRPLSYNIHHVVNDSVLTFKLSQPANLSIEINNDIFHNLHLFANPINNYVANKKDKNLIYFGPGYHKMDSAKLKIPSGKTVYIEGGAVLGGQLLIENVRDVKILGRGLIDPSVKMAVRIANSKNIIVDGITGTQFATGGSDSVTIKNVKSISYYGWGDGMNVFASSNVLLDGVFCRNSDDCTTVYGTRLGFVGGCKNITMQNSTLWADVAHPILIGTHGNSISPDTLENLVYRNIDILDHREVQIDYQGCMSINAGDNNLVRNVKFEDIRVEDFRQGQLVNIRVFYNEKYCTAPGQAVENVLFKNISYNGSRAGMSVIAGYNESRPVKNIVFENLTINGVVIADDMPNKPKWYKTSDMANMFIGEHVKGVQFKKN